MAHWQIMTTPAKPDGELTGKSSDEDRRFRLGCFIDMIVKAQAALAAARRDFEQETAWARRDGQGALADEALARLAERRATAS